MKSFLTCLAATTWIGFVIYIMDGPARSQRRRDRFEAMIELSLHG